MTDLDLDRLRALADAATPGPWVDYNERADLAADIRPMWVVGQMDESGVNWIRDIADVGGDDQDAADAAFIAAARTAVPALTARAEAAEAEVERLRAEVDRCDGCGSTLSRCLRWHGDDDFSHLKCCPDCSHPAEARGYVDLRARAEAAEARLAWLHTPEAVEAVAEALRAYDDPSGNYISTEAFLGDAAAALRALTARTDEEADRG